VAGRASSPGLILARLHHDNIVYAVHRQHLGTASADQERNGEALAPLDEAAAVFRRLRGSDHPQLASALTDRGRVHRALGRFRQAELDLREALRIQRLALPTPHFATARTLTATAQVLLDQDRPEEALPLTEEAVAMAEATLPAGHRIHVEAQAASTSARRRLRNPSPGQ
jgi:serine/threonine-protein kinase